MTATESAVGALAGFTVGITAARRREELGTALERRGARIVYGPAIRIVPLTDDTLLLEATKRCLSGPLDFAVATTGVGFRGWMDVADAWGLKESIVDALNVATILTRGPKVRGAVRAADLREEWSPESESTSEVLEHMLGQYDLAGKRVAIQLHGEPLRELVDALRGAGADVIEVPVYRWEPPEDPAPLHRLIDLVVAAELDAVTFTSAPAAVNFLRTADELDAGASLRSALRGPVLVAAVGPVTAAPLVAAGIPVVQPERFRLGALVREVVDRLPPRAPVVQAGSTASRCAVTLPWSTTGSSRSPGRAWPCCADWPRHPVTSWPAPSWPTCCPATGPGTLSTPPSAVCAPRWATRPSCRPSSSAATASPSDRRVPPPGPTAGPIAGWEARTATPLHRFPARLDGPLTLG